MRNIRMVKEVISTSGETMFKQGKEYPVIETLPDGAVIATSERELPEGVFSGEFEKVKPISE